MRGSVTVLYGSVARGDADANSDLDILFIADAASDCVEVGQFEGLPHSDRLSVTRYDWSQIGEMASYGSLFLKHVRKEGRLLSGGPESRVLIDLLAAMPKYQRCAADILGFELALDDVRDALRDSNDLNFEVAVVASVLRHASILGSYLAGAAAYSRVTSTRRALDLVGMGDSFDAACDIYAYRHIDRGTLHLRSGTSCSRATVDEALALVTALVSRLGRWV